MRKELVDLSHEAMSQHNLARDFYQQMALRMYQTCGRSRPMLLNQVEDFEISRPIMDSTKETLHAIATLRPDIFPAFPYVNAELGGWDVDQINQVLLSLDEG